MEKHLRNMRKNGGSLECFGVVKFALVKDWREKLLA